MGLRVRVSPGQQHLECSRHLALDMMQHKELPLTYMVAMFLYRALPGCNVISADLKGVGRSQLNTW